jgi:hypothetical protein
VKVSSPDGQTWRISRRWLPWRPRKREIEGDIPTEADDPIGCLVLALLGLFVLPVVGVGVVFALELLAVLVLLPFAVLGRVVFGRRWHVEARRGFRLHYEEEAGSWVAARERILSLAGEIQRGEVPPAAFGRRF